MDEGRLPETRQRGSDEQEELIHSWVAKNGNLPENGLRGLMAAGSTSDTLPPDASAPKDDPRIAGVKEFFFQLRKGVKTIGMYRHSVHRYGEYLKPAFEAVQRVLQAGPVALGVTSATFTFSGQSVWEQEGDNLAFRFYSEGVRRLVLRPGLTEDELAKLVLIMLSNPDRGAEDLLAQLWNAGFEHIDHVVVEGFSVGGDLSEEQVKVEVDRIVDYLRARLEGLGDDVLSFARITAEDLELKLEGIDQVRGAVIDLEGGGISEAFKKKVQEQLRLDQVERLPRQITDLMLVQIRDGRVTDPAMAESMLLQVVDALLLSEDLVPIGRIIEGLERIGASNTVAAEVRARFPVKLGEEHRVRRLGEALRHHKGLDLAAVRRYLQVLEASSLPILLELLESIEEPEYRALVVETLGRTGRDHVELFLARLSSPNSQLVRDMLQVLELLGVTERWKHIELALKNPNPAVRQEVVGLLASAKGNEAHRYLLQASTDATSVVRWAAFRAMVQYNPLRAAQDLLRLPKLPDWDKREAREKELVYECLGATHAPDSIKHFAQLIQQKKPLLGGKKIVEQKLLAIIGLQAAGTIPAYKLLQQVVEMGESESVAAARPALYAVKRALQEHTATPAAAGPEGATEAVADQLLSTLKDASRASDAERARIAEAAAKTAREEREGTSVDVSMDEE